MATPSMLILYLSMLCSEGFEPGGDAGVGEVGAINFVEDEADHAPTISQTVRSGSLTE